VGSFDASIPPPALLKPRRLWTGKQIVSALLDALTAHLPAAGRKLSIDGRAKVPDGVWGEAGGRKDVLAVSDAAVTVRGNELLTGVLDKNALGNTSYGLVHAVFEVLGPEAAATLLSVLGRLLTTFEQVYAQTCGVGDLGLSAKHALIPPLHEVLPRANPRQKHTC
jgi:DNA-directed RNA polymerase I subunit RPA1